MYWQLYCLTDQLQNVTHRITILSIVSWCETWSQAKGVQDSSAAKDTWH